MKTDNLPLEYNIELPRLHGYDDNEMNIFRLTIDFDGDNENCYLYHIYKNDDELNGGACTGSLSDSLDMAYKAFLYEIGQVTIY